MGALLLLVSCQSEEDFSTPSLQQAKTFHFYGVKSVDDQPELRGVAQRNKLWSPGTVITVKLLNDPYNMAGSIENWVSEWEQYANIKFDFVTSGDAEVRLGFDWDGSKWITWSYTGTDCKYVKDQNEATVNFAFWDTANEQDKKADVLRAFGQVLGLELEHRHLSFDAGWTSRIQQYWEGEIEDIPWSELKKYVFDPIDTRNLEQTDEYDANSIMIWPFDRRYAANTAREYNYVLSDKDKEFIQYLYPGEVVEEDLLFSYKSYEMVTTYIILIGNGNVRIDWGDGNVEERLIQSYQMIFHSYSQTGTYTVKVYGEDDLLTRFANFDPEYMAYEEYEPDWDDASRNMELLYAKKNLTNITSLMWNGKVSGNLDLAGYANLEALYLFCRNLRTVDISDSPKIRRIELKGNLEDLILPDSYNYLSTLDLGGVVDGTRYSAQMNQLDLSRAINLSTLLLTNDRMERLVLPSTNKLTLVVLKSLSLTQIEGLASHPISTLYLYLPLLSNLNISSSQLFRLKMDCPQLNNVTWPGALNLYHAYLNNSGFLYNREASIDFVTRLVPPNTGDYLPDRGCVVYDARNTVFAPWVQSIAASKNWQIVPR
jgi:hypothetical protein